MISYGGSRVEMNIEQNPFIQINMNKYITYLRILVQLQFFKLNMIVSGYLWYFVIIMSTRFKVKPQS
jgi:hypothetical protein